MLETNANVHIQPETWAQSPNLDYFSPTAAIDPAASPQTNTIEGRCALPLSLPMLTGLSAFQDDALGADMWKKSLLSLLPPHEHPISPSPSKHTKALHEAFGSSHYNLLILSVENNFAGFGSTPIGLVLRSLNDNADMSSRLLLYHRATPIPAARALAENMVRAAIENCDYMSVLEYLSTGLVNPDKIVCLVDGKRYTAIERAAMLRSYEVVEVLIRARINVNATYEEDVGNEQGPLEWAVRKSGKYVPVEMRLINLLLKYDTKVRPGLILAAIRWQDANLVRKLFWKASVSDDHFKAFMDRIMVDAVRLLDEKLATRVLTRSVQEYLKPSPKDGSTPRPELLQSISIVAAFRGFEKIVLLVVDHLVDLDRSLVAAIRGGHKTIVELFLNRGAKIDSPPCWIEEQLFTVSLAEGCPANERMATPLAEAIRAGNYELMNDLERKGALSQISEEGRFGAAIYAASEVGNLNYVENLIKLAPCMHGNVLTPALSIAIIKCHDDIALRLLRAVADANGAQSSSSSSSPLFEALRRKSRKLVNAIMESKVVPCPSLVPAIEWNDRSIINDLISLGAKTFTAQEV